MAYKKLTKKQKEKNKALSRKLRVIWKEKVKGKGKTELTFKAFKARAVSKAEAFNISVKEAAKKIANSYDLGYGDYKAQAKENLLTSMKEKFRATYDELRRKAGRFTKGEHLADKLTWDQTEDAYILTSSTGDRYIIRSDQSPKNMYLEKI